MAVKPFKELRPNKDRVSAGEYNRAMKLLEGLANSLGVNFYIDSCGIFARKTPSPATTRTDIRIFEVQAQAMSGGQSPYAIDGVYVCHEKTIDSTYFEDETGHDRFVDKEDEPTDVNIFNLLENDCEADYVPALAKYDLMAAWQKTDDEGNMRWQGIPLVNGPRRAITTQAAPAATYITANLYDRHGSEITSGLGAGINIYCDINITSSENLQGVFPYLADNQPISVYNFRGKWYCDWGFQAINKSKGLDFDANKKLYCTLFECS